MLKITTKYITADDYKRYFGVDLGKTLKGDDNESDKASRFLMRVENDVELWLNYNYKQSIHDIYDDLNDFQKEKYQLALLEQAKYMFKNGDIGGDSGYDQDSGVIASRSEIKEIMISTRTEMYLKLAGLCNRYM